MLLVCRWSYLPCDIRLNQHFQPVIRRAPDGMLTIDFRAFDLLSDTGTVIAPMRQASALGSR